VELVDVIAEVLEAEAWGPGGGLRSPGHWVAWRTGLSARRAEGLVQIARRLHDLPMCVGLFRAGRLSEDAMVLIAAKVPASRDAEIAAKAPELLHSQLRRVLAHLPEIVAEAAPRATPERQVRFGFRSDGWWEQHSLLPADEGALCQRALEEARQELFHDRRDDADPAVRGPVTWADAQVRAAERSLDAIDPAVARNAVRGERAQIFVHLDARSDGNGQARIHLGPQLPEALRRYLCCDAKVRAVIEDAAGRVLGITPSAPTVNPRLRAVIEARDEGCRFPGCSQRRWVHVHHLVHREHGGPTVPRNLCCLCPYHHRLHHQGAFQIDGDPERADGLRFHDRWGHSIGPPRFGPLAPPLPGAELTFTPPTGERLHARWFTWN
jgi:hypothetical protein